MCRIRGNSSLPLQLPDIERRMDSFRALLRTPWGAKHVALVTTAGEQDWEYLPKGINGKASGRSLIHPACVPQFMQIGRQGEDAPKDNYVHARDKAASTAAGNMIVTKD